MRITNLEGWIDVIAGTAYTAAGTSTLTSAALDTGADFDSVLVLAKFGTAAADNTLSPRQPAGQSPTAGPGGTAGRAAPQIAHRTPIGR